MMSGTHGNTDFTFANSLLKRLLAFLLGVGPAKLEVMPQHKLVSVAKRDI